MPKEPERIIPETNIEIVAAMYTIEVGLRELIIETFQQLGDPRWYKHRLPPDILKKYQQGREYERNQTWVQCVPHHPVYYLDFPDIATILEKNDNWETAFKAIFRRKDVTISGLRRLEPIRNKVAHNRKASSADLAIVEAEYAALCSSLGGERLKELAGRCTRNAEIPARLRDLSEEARISFVACKVFDPVLSLDAWHSASKQWWFDTGYLGCDIDPIVRYFAEIDEYSKLPRKRGSGPLIEKWVRSRNLKGAYNAAEAAFRCLLGSI
jgi:hypothetical protein